MTPSDSPVPKIGG